MYVCSMYTICFPYILYTDEREKKRLDCRENMKAVGKLLCCAAPKPRLCCLRSVILAWRSASAMAQIWNPSGMLLRAVNQNQRGKLFAKGADKKREFTFPFSGGGIGLYCSSHDPATAVCLPDWKRIKNGKLKPHNVDGRINVNLKGCNSHKRAKYLWNTKIS